MKQLLLLLIVLLVACAPEAVMEQKEVDTSVPVGATDTEVEANVAIDDVTALDDDLALGELDSLDEALADIDW